MAPDLAVTDAPGGASRLGDRQLTGPSGASRFVVHAQILFSTKEPLNG